MGGNTGSVVKSGIEYRSSPGGLRRPQTVPDWSGTKNRLSRVSGRFQPRSCRRQTDQVPGRLRPPGTKPPTNTRLSPDPTRCPEASSGLLSLPQTRIADSCFAKLLDFLGIYIYKIRDLITIVFLGTQQDATF